MKVRPRVERRGGRPRRGAAVKTTFLVIPSAADTSLDLVRSVVCRLAWECPERYPDSGRGRGQKIGAVRIATPQIDVNVRSHSRHGTRANDVDAWSLCAEPAFRAVGQARDTDFVRLSAEVR